MLFDLLGGRLSFPAAVIEILAILVIVFLILPFHEWAHAYTAYKLGDTSIKYRGRLTLNPLAHIDPFGALSLLLFNFGWAKPVPIDPSNFKKPKLGMALVALMGPVANLAAAMLGGFIYFALAAFASSFALTPYLQIFFGFYIQVNVNLAVFNLLPIPPLDGSKLMFAFLPDRAVAWFYRYQQIISIVLIVLLFVGVLRVPLTFLSDIIYRVLINGLCRLPFAAFL